MAEGAAAANATGIISTSTSLNEAGKLFGQFFGILFTIIGYEATNTSKGKSQLLMALVFMVALFYMFLVLVTMFELQIQSFLPFMLVMLLLGSVVSSLALMMISPTIAGIHLGLWFLIFALIGYKYRKELYHLITKKMIKNFVEDQTQSANSEIPVVESGRFRSRENLNV